ncbi:MAG: hypothetical protein H6600_01030 [Flavobacteriales bacterium]|nr:hypothetical protein [Flavobacteriales bacterium]MCB9197020.1 hypothetical protein [Flavobacteriales bacterium]
MDFSHSIVNSLNQQIQGIVSERNNLRQEVLILQERIAELELDVAKERNSLVEVEQKYKVLKLAKSLDGDKQDESRDLKLKINEMVRELDKCIALLNK